MLAVPLPQQQAVFKGGVRRAPVSSPSQHVGYFRAAIMVAGALSAAWRQGKVLVDSGSQQEPLLSHDFAAAVAGPPGPVVGAAAQADGSLLRLYSVPPVDISINGRPTRTRFRSANIAPYDCILGESWLYEHAAALDYKNNKLWTATKAGWQPLELNHVPSASALQRVPGWAAAQRQVAEAESVRRVSALLAPASAPTLCGPIMGAHQRRIARRHSGVAVVADVARVLPEDVELELGEVTAYSGDTVAEVAFCAEALRFALGRVSLSTEQLELELAHALAKLRCLECSASLGWHKPW